MTTNQQNRLNLVLSTLAAMFPETFKDLSAEDLKVIRNQSANRVMECWHINDIVSYMAAISPLNPIIEESEACEITKMLDEHYRTEESSIQAI